MFIYQNGFGAGNRRVRKFIAHDDDFVPGMDAVRRGTALIGRVTIGDTIEETRSVAEVIPRHLVKGMVLQKGDEIIKFDQ